MITEDRITEIFCLADDFCKYFSSELKKHQLSDGKVHRNKPARLSDAEVITILILFHSKGFHWREAENIILPIVNNNSLVWFDKNKGLEWLSSAKSNSQAIANQTLDDAAKKVHSFENPTIGRSMLPGGLEQEG